jgi:hypothetical protein
MALFKERRCELGRKKGRMNVSRWKPSAAWRESLFFTWYMIMYTSDTVKNPKRARE